METLSVHLPNGSDGDSLVLVRLLHEGRCVLFDSGDVARLPARDALRVSHVFVSHCHVDHFIGFDALLRPRVCRDDRLVALGPPGFLDRVESRLMGYTWNLVEGNHFVLTASEIRGDRVLSARFDSGKEFRREDLGSSPRGDVVHEDGSFRVHSEALDHVIVSQAYSVRGPERLAIRTDALASLRIPEGRWLGDLKHAVAAGEDRAALFTLPTGEARPLGEVADLLVAARAGERVAYVTDTLLTKATRERIVRLADSADVFACEAPFLAEDGERAAKTRHLTAAQAGELAAEAGVKELLLFHVSDRYGGVFARHAEEAAAASRGKVEVRVQERWPLVE